MINVDQAFQEVMTTYQGLTGRPIQPARTDLPPEVDPAVHVEARYRQFRSLLEAASGARPVPAREVAEWAPPADVHEIGTEVRYEIDVPGVPRDRIRLSATPGWLVVRGERLGGEVERGQARHRERPHGAFVKALALPARARRDAIEASLRDGVLTVRVPIDGRAVANEAPIEVRSA